VAVWHSLDKVLIEHARQQRRVRHARGLQIRLRTRTCSRCRI
jgi:hypothetical protein